jgi:DNA-binding MarR family transcriptional regulator
VALEIRALDASLDLLDHAVAVSFGIGRTDLRAMELVSRQGPATCSQLASQLHMTSGSVTALVDRLERAGYLQRRYDPADRRKVLVHLTAAGRERERRAFEPLAKDSIEMLGSYTDRDLTVIADFLARSRALVERSTARIDAAPGKGRRTPRPSRRR